MSDDDRQRVRDALRAEDVAAHYQISGTWRGRWLRSKRCPTDDHATDAMGLARDGKWHCWSCDTGGDLLTLIARAERLDPRADFPRVLEIAAGIAGVDLADDFGGVSKPAPPKRPPPPALPPLAERVRFARKRAAWLWARLSLAGRGVAAYLDGRGLSLDLVAERDEIRQTPIAGAGSTGFCGDDRACACSRCALARFVRQWSWPGVAIGVRAIEDGALVDVRVRRFDPMPDQPKVVGMLGGVTREGETLVGCYGWRPNSIGQYRTTVIVEGLADYLTALQLWPDAQILGAVDAGSMPLLAAYVATELAPWPSYVKMIIVEQWDGEDGAAAKSVNAACKRARGILGPSRVGWIGCAPHKDLNDAYRVGVAPLPIWEP